MRKARRARERAEREAAGLAAIARIAIRYVDEIYAPNIREPFSIVNRRNDLVEQVAKFRGWHPARRAA